RDRIARNTLRKLVAPVDAPTDSREAERRRSPASTYEEKSRESAFRRMSEEYFTRSAVAPPRGLRAPAHRGGRATSGRPPASILSSRPLSLSPPAAAASPDRGAADGWQSPGPPGRGSPPESQSPHAPQSRGCPRRAW